MCENSKYAPRATVLLHHSLTSTYHCLRVCPSELVRVLCQHPPYLAVHSSLARELSAYKSARSSSLTIHFALLISASRHSLQRYNKIRSLLSQSSFQNPTK